MGSQRKAHSSGVGAEANSVLRSWVGAEKKPGQEVLETEALLCLYYLIKDSQSACRERGQRPGEFVQLCLPPANQSETLGRVCCLPPSRQKSFLATKEPESA